MENKSRYLFFVLLTATIAFTSCEEDDLDDLFGDPVEKFLGTWKCEEEGTETGSGWVYDVTIIRNPDNSSEILIRNFYLQGDNEKARALITGNTLTIPNQRICDDTMEIQGSGSYDTSKDEIYLNYSTNDGATEDIVTARYFKP